MKLKIYDKKKVVKTYTADTYDLMWGVVEDVAKAVKLDELKSNDEMEIFKLVMGLVMRSMDTVRDLLKDIFDGLTDEELKNARVKDIAYVLIDVVKYTISELRDFNSKN